MLAYRLRTVADSLRTSSRKVRQIGANTLSVDAYGAQASILPRGISRMSFASVTRPFSHMCSPDLSYLTSLVDADAKMQLKHDLNLLMLYRCLQRFLFRSLSGLLLGLAAQREFHFMTVMFIIGILFTVAS